MNYTNTLSNLPSVTNDFDDYSVIASQMMGYNNGQLTVTNNRLEFSTTSSWLGVKTLKTPLSINENWAAQVNFHLSEISNLTEGHYYDIGLVVSLGTNFSTAFQNRIVFKAIESGNGRFIRASLYSSNIKQKSYEDLTILNNCTDGTLKVVFNQATQSIVCFYKKESDTEYFRLCDFPINNSTNSDYESWNILPDSELQISIFAGSEPDNTVVSFPEILSGQMYLKQFQIDNLLTPWLYTLNNNIVTITGYTGFGGTVNVPNELHGFPVKKIGSDYSVVSVFGPVNTSITSITLPNNLTNIGTHAFYNCLNLTNVIISTNVLSIGENAFAGCIKIENVVLPQNISQIQRGTFAGCKKLQSINLPNSLSSIGMSAFFECSQLLNIAIPSNVQNVYDGAFFGCSSLTNIFVPSSVSYIGTSAFSDCTNLQNINVDTNNSVYTSINGVLYSKNFKTLIQFPAGQTGNVLINSNVTNILIGAFDGASKIETIDIPENVVSIGQTGTASFVNCKNLTSINVDFNNQTYASLDGVLYSKNFKSLIQYPQGKTGNFKIPSFVKEIKSLSFYTCSGITGVEIPGSVNSLGEMVFQKCPNLTILTFLDGAPYPSYGSFSGSLNLSQIYLLGNGPSESFSVFNFPSQAKFFFKPNAFGWSSFNFYGRNTALIIPKIKNYQATFEGSSYKQTLQFDGFTGLSYKVQKSTNLINWSVQTNFIGEGSELKYSDISTNQKAFYRILQE